jgi:hypothetical protein
MLQKLKFVTWFEKAATDGYFWNWIWFCFMHIFGNWLYKWMNRWMHFKGVLQKYYKFEIVTSSNTI